MNSLTILLRLSAVSLCAAMLSPTIAQTADAPDLTGIWDGGPRARPINGENMPWEAHNFPILNERALA